MPSSVPGIPGSYLRNILADGVKPFHYRSGVRSLLGVPETDTGRFTFQPSLPPVGFRYIQQGESLIGGQPYMASYNPDKESFSQNGKMSSLFYDKSDGRAETSGNYPGSYNIPGREMINNNLLKREGTESEGSEGKGSFEPANKKKDSTDPVMMPERQDNGRDSSIKKRDIEIPGHTKGMTFPDLKSRKSSDISFQAPDSLSKDSELSSKEQIRRMTTHSEGPPDTLVSKKEGKTARDTESFKRVAENRSDRPGRFFRSLDTGLSGLPKGDPLIEASHLIFRKYMSGSPGVSAENSKQDSSSQGLKQEESLLSGSGENSGILGRVKKDNNNKIPGRSEKSRQFMSSLSLKGYGSQLKDIANNKDTANNIKHMKPSIVNMMRKGMDNKDAVRPGPFDGRGVSRPSGHDSNFGSERMGLDKIELIRRRVHELASRISSKEDKGKEEIKQQAGFKHSSKPPQEVVFINAPYYYNVRPPYAFWVRSYLSHYHLKILR